MEKALGKVPVNIKTVNDGSSEFMPIGENQVIPINLLNDNNRLAKLITLLDAIETIETAVDGSIRIIYKSNVNSVPSLEEPSTSLLILRFPVL